MFEKAIVGGFSIALEHVPETTRQKMIQDWKNTGAEEFERGYGVIGNTFRSFRGIKEPSTTYQEAFKSLDLKKELCELVKNSDHKDRWEQKIRLADLLAKKFYYSDESKKADSLHNDEAFQCKCLKILDLSSKALAAKSKMNDGQLNNLDVPLDKYSLTPLAGKPDKKDRLFKGQPSMGVIKTFDQYKQVQHYIRDNFKNWGPPIYYDVIITKLARDPETYIEFDFIKK